MHRVLPEDDYLRAIGELAYRVSSLEWSILGDMKALGVPPEELDVNDLIGRTTGRIARELRASAKHWDDRPALQAWALRAAEALGAIAKRRNHVLHARPATDPEGRQRLYRMVRDGARLEAFWITDEFLAIQNEAAEAAARYLNELRVLFSEHEESVREANKKRRDELAGAEKAISPPE